MEKNKIALITETAKKTQTLEVRKQTNQPSNEQTNKNPPPQSYLKGLRKYTSE